MHVPLDFQVTAVSLFLIFFFFFGQDIFSMFAFSAFTSRAISAGCFAFPVVLSSSHHLHRGTPISSLLDESGTIVAFFQFGTFACFGFLWRFGQSGSLLGHVPRRINHRLSILGQNRASMARLANDCPFLLFVCAF